jgi:chromosome segregation ATPase
METKLKETTLAKAETDAALELLKEQYAAIKAQKEQEEQSAHLSLKELKDQLQKRIEEHRKDKDEFDDKIQAMNRKNIKVESEFEKERALFEQKVMFLEKSLEEKSSTEKEYLSNWNNQKSELSSEIRSVCQKYEAELKENRLLLEEEKEKSTELEAQLQELRSTLDEKSNAWAE